MEIKLQCGDTITIPKDCKAIVKDGSVVFEREKEDKEFKDGDILIDDRKFSEFPCKIIMIYKGTKSEEGGYECYFFRNLIGSLVINEGCCSSDFVKIRPATEEEKAELFAEMKEQGLKWNAEEKKVEEIRWRAILHDYYYFISTTGTICKTEAKSEEINTCNSRYDFFNQFRTEEQAEEGARRVKETLMKYHEEIGE